jgi:nucleoid-associated protein YgaU
MRLLLGLLILGGLFLVAANWQENLRSSVLKTRRLERGIPSHVDTTVNGEDGWATLVLGAPSGAKSIPPKNAAPPESITREPAPGAPNPESVTPQPLPPTIQPDQERRIAPGDSLSRICEQHYGTSRPRLVQALALYNSLSSPNQIRVGATLLLPDLDLLQGD